MLVRHHIMDYSLLIGIENKFNLIGEDGTNLSASGRKQSMRSILPKDELLRLQRHIFVSPHGTQTFHFSIIDFL